MEFLVLLVYFLSYSALFLNIGFTVFLYRRSQDRSLLYLFPGLVSSLAYLLFHNAVFLSNAILKVPVDEHNISYLALMAPLYCVQTFTEVLFIGSATNPRFRGWLAKALLVASLVPALALPLELVSRALGNSFMAEPDFWKTVVTYGTSLVLVLAILGYILPNIRNARSDFHRASYKAIVAVFCVFQPVYMLQLFWNSQLASSLRPLTSENLYYCVMNICLAVLLARYYLPTAPALPPSPFIGDRPQYIPDRFGVTEREKEVIGLLRQGLNNAQIAGRLGISAVTVKNHIHNIYQKTGSRNRIEILNCFYPPEPATMSAKPGSQPEKINLN